MPPLAQPEGYIPVQLEGYTPEPWYDEPILRRNAVAACAGSLVGGYCEHVTYYTAGADQGSGDGNSIYTRVAYCAQTEVFVPGTGVVPRARPLL